MEVGIGLFRQFWLLAVRSVALAAFGLAVFGGANAAEVTAVRFGAAKASATRVVFDLTGPVDYTLSGDGQGAGRLIIDFKGLSTDGVADAGEGHILRYAITSSGSERARAVLDFRRTARIKEHFVLPASRGNPRHRLVIDLVSADKSAFLASLPPRYEDMTPILEEATRAEAVIEEPEVVQEPAPLPTPTPLPTIVIDAGHGGADPGARGAGGLLEKTATLAAATRLSALLRAKGRYRIVLTRESDARRSLDERSTTAREAGATLFISLHADSHENAKLRGASVYTLSEDGEKRSAREAQTQGDYHVYRENIKEEAPGVDTILFDLAQRETKNASSQFADILVERLEKVTPLINNTHRTADLYVLLSPDVPAVLLELGFISNKSDEANLSAPAWREKAMTAVAEAIDRYFEMEREAQHAANGSSRIR